MTKWVAGVVAAGLMAGAGAAPVPPDGRKGPVYYSPTRVGDTAVYESGGKASGSYVVVAAGEKDGVVTVTYDHRAADGKVLTRSKLAVSASGVAALEAGAGLPYDPPLRLLKVPAKAGDVWAEKTTCAGVATAHTFTVGGVEPVTVPAGTYQCVRVEEEVTVGGRTLRTTSWHAAGVGVVRSETAKGRRELKSFTPGKPTP